MILFICDTPDTELIWDESYRLTWSDFKGEPQDEIDAVAITASGLSSQFSARTTPSRLVDYTATITANFYPDKSWYKPGKVNEIVLAHEQLHFDITELNARLLRRNIEEFEFTINIKSEMNFLVDKANKDLEIMQTRYDNETNYSMNVEAQKQWQIHIQEELLKLTDFK